MSPANVASLACRRDERVDELRDGPASAVLGCDESEFRKVMPHVCRGVDLIGRPVIYKHMGGQCELSRLLDSTDVASLCRYNWWVTEQCARRRERARPAAPSGARPR